MIVTAGESDKERLFTYRQLYEKVQIYYNSLKGLGVNIGDRVAAYIPNCFEAVAMMLACASIGAIWTSASPDFGIVVFSFIYLL